MTYHWPNIENHLFRAFHFLLLTMTTLWCWTIGAVDICVKWMRDSFQCDLVELNFTFSPGFLNKSNSKGRWSNRTWYVLIFHICGSFFSIPWMVLFEFNCVWLIENDFFWSFFLKQNSWFYQFFFVHKLIICPKKTENKADVQVKAMIISYAGVFHEWNFTLHCDNDGCSRMRMVSSCRKLADRKAIATIDDRLRRMRALTKGKRRC